MGEDPPNRPTPIQAQRVVPEAGTPSQACTGLSDPAGRASPLRSQREPAADRADRQTRRDDLWLWGRGLSRSGTVCRRRGVPVCGLADRHRRQVGNVDRIGGGVAVARSNRKEPAADVCPVCGGPLAEWGCCPVPLGYCHVKGLQEDLSRRPPGPVSDRPEDCDPTVRSAAAALEQALRQRRLRVTSRRERWSTGTPATFEPASAGCCPSACRWRGRSSAGLGLVTVSVVDPFGNVPGVMYNRHYLEVME